MTNSAKIAFLGAGNMASALIRSALGRGGVKADHLAATDVRPEATDELARKLGILTFARNRDACAWADVIVLAVKPQVAPGVLAEIESCVRSDHVVLSIAAGLSCHQIASALKGRGRVIRAMPNTPALVGEGATALCKGPGARDEDLLLAQQLLSATGVVVTVEEKLMDGVTGLSGSGPAYAFVAIEALSDAGVKAGLPRDIATRLAAQTLLGAAKMVLELGEHPGKLKDMVTSPAGTTIAGIEALERGGLRAALMAAVDAAVSRSRALGE